MVNTADLKSAACYGLRGSIPLRSTKTYITKGNVRMNYSVRLDCAECNGSGKKQFLVNLGDILDSVNEVGIENKINAIKQIRNKYSMGLRDAKDLTEAAIYFIKHVEGAFPKYDEEKIG